MATSSPVPSLRYWGSDGADVGRPVGAAVDGAAVVGAADGAAVVGSADGVAVVGWGEIVGAGVGECGEATL